MMWKCAELKLRLGKWGKLKDIKIDRFTHPNSELSGAEFTQHLAEFTQHLGTDNSGAWIGSLWGTGHKGSVLNQFFWFK